MPLPFDMLAVMLYLGWYAGEPPRSHPPLMDAALLCLAALAVMALFAGLCNFVAVRALRRPGRSLAARRRIAANAEFAVRAAQVGLFALLLRESAFPWSLAEAAGVAPDSAGGHMFLVELFGLLPYVGLFFAAWLPLYTLHKTVSYGTWTRRSFILNKSRYSLYMIAAWAPLAFLADLLTEYLFALPFLFVGAAWMFPAALARLWGCKPLPPGETMDLVRSLEKEAGAEFSKIFLWEPGGGAMNAAAVGLAKPFRYLFLTPGLIRGMTRDELSAVVLHELGHVRHRHLVFYLLTTLGGMNAAVVAGALLPLDSSAERFFATAVLILAYFRVVFGWLSRNMERQADLFALEHARAAAPLANALEKIGIAAGHVRLAESWHHLGIAERVDFLRRAERFPELASAHNAGVRMLKAGGYAASLFTIGFLMLETAPGLFAVPPAAPADESARIEQAHWRRVSALMPGDTAARLHLAYSLAGRPGGKGEAIRLADEAAATATTPEERAAAEKLLSSLLEE
jgi:Zn-dependent protease with chaperone function